MHDPAKVPFFFTCYEFYQHKSEASATTVRVPPGHHLRLPSFSFHRAAVSLFESSLFPKTGILVVDCALTRQTDGHAAPFRGLRATTEECEEVKENSGRP